MKTIFTHSTKLFTIIFISLFSFSTTIAQQTISVSQPTGGFNINGSLTAGAGTGDWVQGSGGGYVLNNDGTPVNSLTTSRKIDGYAGGSQDFIFSGSKFNDNPNDWKWSVGNAGGKGDINNVLYHLGNDPVNVNDPTDDKQWLFVAGDRKETSGTSNLYFEFLQNTLTRNANGTFNSAGPNGGRTLNDVAIYIGYVNGGAVAEIKFYVWSNIGTIANPNYTYVEKFPPVGTYYGFTNGGTQSVPYSAFGNSTYTANQFVEAAFNVTAFLQSTNLCDGLKVKTLFVSTKSSAVESASLDDFIEPIQVGIDLGQATISYAGPFCPVGTAGVTQTGVQGGTYSSSSTDLKFVSTSTGEINLATSIPGTYTVTYTFITPGCSNPKTTTTIVTVDPATVAGAVTGGSTVCTGTNSTLLTLGAHIGTIIRWESSLNGTTWTPIINATNTYTATNLTATTQYRAVIQSAACAAANSTATTITVDPLPTASAAGGSQTICSNATATVSGATASNGTILWTHNGTGSLSNATTLTPTYTAAAGDEGNTVTLTMTVTSNNTCGIAKATTTYTVNVDALPQASAAGGSQTICSNATATVSGATASNGTILWTHNGTGSLSNA
ncbi:MAG TPA: hypothetical protein VFS71_06090, partial [Flavobacterium sp.]|uniref:hypothetical protein n=1 Tax=Flavobacterium sp. TaxID=239 RepID=UPI002DBF7493